MRHLGKSVECRRLQAAVDQQRVVVADKSKADDADSLEEPRTKEREAFCWIPFELGRDVRTLDEYGGDDDDHSDEGETRCS